MSPNAHLPLATKIRNRYLFGSDALLFASATILAAAEEVPPGANPTINVICPSFDDAGLESITRTAKNNSARRGT